MQGARICFRVQFQACAHGCRCDIIGIDGQGAIQRQFWYLSGATLIGAAFCPTPLPTGWQLVATADFNSDGNPDYLLYNMNTRGTIIWYLNNNVLVNAAFGPMLPAGWAVVAAADFNADGYPDYVLYNARTRQTEIWYLQNNVFVSAAFGPTLSDAWSLIAP